MDELKERDPSAHPPEPVVEEDEERPTFLVIAQFFLIPLAVILVCVGLFFLFGVLTEETRTASEYLAEIRSGSPARRYQAAFELSKILAYQPDLAREPGFVPELARAFQDARDDDDPELRRYLALALGRVADPRALGALVAGLQDQDAQTRIYCVWALGAVSLPEATDPVVGALTDRDAGVRKMAAHVLGGLGDRAAAPALEAALADDQVDVQWNAALSLARLGSPAGLGLLRRMLDRSYLEGVPGLDGPRAREVMVNAIRGVALLGDQDSVPNLERLGSADSDLEVRAAALAALEEIRGEAG